MSEGPLKLLARAEAERDEAHRVVDRLTEELAAALTRAERAEQREAKALLDLDASRARNRELVGQIADNAGPEVPDLSTDTSRRAA